MTSPVNTDSARVLDLTDVPSVPTRAVLAARVLDLLLLAAIGAVSILLLGLRLLDDPSDLIAVILGWGFTAVVPALTVAMFVIDDIRIGQTPGKAIMGIRTIYDSVKNRVVSASDSRVPDPGIPALWRDTRVLRVAGQVLVVVVIAAALRWMFHNFIVSLDTLGIPKDFDFMGNPYQSAIRDAHGFDTRDSIWSALFIGAQNTLVAAIVGILIASVVGLLVGIARLSSNWLVAKAASLFVESFRNIPPLVVIAFFYLAIFVNGPLPRFDANNSPWLGKFFGSDSNWLLVSKNASAIPSLGSESNVGWFWLLVLGAAIAAFAIGVWRTRYNVATGEPHHRVLWSLGAFVVIVVISFIALGGPYSWSWPAVSANGRRIVGGFGTNSGYLGLTVALGLYTASFVAEIIRGSILAVPKGQSEAAIAVALKPGQRYRHVVLPQAMRIAIPPYISECLNLIKNTSLGIVVAYPDIVLVGATAWGNGNPAPQLILIIAVFYLLTNLVVSLLLNLYNRSVQLKDR